MAKKGKKIEGWWGNEGGGDFILVGREKEKRNAEKRFPPKQKESGKGEPQHRDTWTQKESC